MTFVNILEHLREFESDASQLMNSLDLDSVIVSEIHQRNDQKGESAENENVEQTVVDSPMVLVRFNNLLHPWCDLKVIYLHQVMLVRGFLHLIMVIKLIQNRHWPHQ